MKTKIEKAILTKVNGNMMGQLCTNTKDVVDEFGIVQKQFESKGQKEIRKVRFRLKCKENE